MHCNHLSIILSTQYSSPQMPTDLHPLQQPYVIKHHAVLAASEGRLNHTGLVRFTSLMDAGHSKTRGCICMMTCIECCEDLRQLAISYRYMDDGGLNRLLALVL